MTYSEDYNKTIYSISLCYYSMLFREDTISADWLIDIEEWSNEVGWHERPLLDTVISFGPASWCGWKSNKSILGFTPRNRETCPCNRVILFRPHASPSHRVLQPLPRHHINYLYGRARIILRVTIFFYGSWHRVRTFLWPIGGAGYKSGFRRNFLLSELTVGLV